MDCENATESPAKVFAFTEYSDGKILKSYSRGNGRFFTEIPSSGLTITFGLTKTADSLDITIYDDSLIQWLRTFPSLRDCLDSSKVSMAFSSHGAFPSVNMDVLLPCYSELSAEFDRYKRERRSFDALDLFVFHFLREGSVFAAFGVENLHEKQILTDLHLNHIQSQYSSMSEDLDRLDEMACGLDKPDKMDEPFKLAQFECVAGLGIICEIINRLVLAEFSQMDEPFRSDLLVAVKQRDFTAVSKLLARTLFRVDSGILCRAIECYEPTIFHLLLEHGADVQGYCRQPLYVAARAGQMDALRQLLNHGGHVNSSRSSPTPLEGAVDGGHFEIVRYLVEEHAAKIDGHKYMSMLSSTFDNGRREIYDYLLRSTVALPRQYHRQLSVCSTTGPASVYSEEDLNGLAISTAGISSHTRDLLLLMGRSQTYLEVVKVLVNSNMDIGSMQQTSPLYRAAVNGHLDLVRFLFKRATTIPTADIILLIWNAAENGHLEVADFLLGYNPDIYPILLATMMHLAAISANHHAIVQLTRLGAVIDAKDHQSPLWTGVQCGYRKVFFCQGTTTDADASAQPEVADEDALEGPPYQCPYAKTLGPTQCCHWDLIDLLEKHCAKITDVETCPTVAAIRARERRAIAHRLFAEIKSSRETLLEAGARHNVSDGLGAFMGQVGTHLSIWKSGTRAIRDISEGYMPSGLHDIVSALQVADAMRLAVPSSKIVCSNKEFVDDIPRWASLLSPEDRSLFCEIVSQLWGIPAESTNSEWEGPFDRDEALSLLQELVNNLVRTSGLFDHESANSCGTYRLQSLRKLTFSLNVNHASKERHSLAEWDPFPTPEVQSSLPSDIPKPPDPEVKQSMVLARITILMAGAIFGTILLYLCLSRHGFPTIRQPVLASGAKNGSVSDQMITRNCFILAMYIGSSFLPGSVNVEVTEHSLAASPPVDIAQGHMVSYNSNDPQGESLDAGDAVMQDAARSCSPSLLSYPTASPATTAISPLTMTTGTPGSSIASTSEDGSIRCEYCKSEFKLGKNGRRGQASNLQKHKKRDHPETIPGYHRVLYKCRWGCGATTPDKSNIKVHERQHCAKRKGKQPRRHGKWREDGAAL